MCKQDLVDLLVSGVNAYTMSIHKSNNSGWKDTEHKYLEWSYVRVVSVMPVLRYIKSRDLGADDIDEIPEDTTHIMYTALDWLDSRDNVHSLFGYRFPVKLEENNAEILEDIDEVLGGGPILQDATLYNALEWMTITGEDITEYPEVTMKDLSESDLYE